METRPFWATRQEWKPLFTQKLNGPPKTFDRRFGNHVLCSGRDTPILIPRGVKNHMGYRFSLRFRCIVRSLLADSRSSNWESGCNPDEVHHPTVSRIRLMTLSY